MYSYEPLLVGYFVNRLNRYIAEVRVPALGDRVVSCYLPNPGSMLGMCTKLAEVRISTCSSATRKFKHTMEAIKINDVWIGCNTQLANQIVANLLSSRSLKLPATMEEYTSFRREVTSGASRIDFMLDHGNGTGPTHMEVKTVTMASDWYDIETNSERASGPYSRFPKSRPTECNSREQIALFPDCESTRAQKHLIHLGTQAQNRPWSSILVYVIMRNDVLGVSASKHCDPEYARMFAQYIGNGLECISLMCEIDVRDPNDSHIVLKGYVPVRTHDSVPEVKRRITTANRTRKRVKPSA